MSMKCSALFKEQSAKRGLHFLIINRMLCSGDNRMLFSDVLDDVALSTKCLVIITLLDS